MTLLPDGLRTAIESLVADTDSFIVRDEDGYYCKQCQHRLEEADGTHEVDCLVSKVIDLANFLSRGR